MSKTDYVHEILKWVSYNRYTVAATTVAGLFLGLASCQFTAKDPLTGEKVTKEVLQATLEAKAKSSVAGYDKMLADYKAALAVAQENDSVLFARYESAMNQIDQQKQFWQGVIQWVEQIPAVSGNPLLGGALGLGGTLFGIGTLADNRRKDRKIKTAKTV